MRERSEQKFDDHIAVDDKLREDAKEVRGMFDHYAVLTMIKIRDMGIWIEE